MGTVPKSVTRNQLSKASTPAHRKAEPAPVPARIATAIPAANAGKKMAGTSTRKVRIRPCRNWMCDRSSSAASGTRTP